MTEKQQMQTKTEETSEFSSADTFFSRINTLITRFSLCSDPYVQISAYYILNDLCSELLSYSNVHCRNFKPELEAIKKQISLQKIDNIDYWGLVSLGKNLRFLFERVNLLAHKMGLIVPLKDESENYPRY